MLQPRPPFEFSWLSPLGISVMLFLLSGVLHFLIGVLTPFLIDSGFGRKILFISNRTDTEFFGTEPSLLLQQNPDVDKIRKLLAGGMGGFLAVVGIFIIAVSWFGLRGQQTWALVTLALCGFILAAGWYLTLRFYINANIRLTLADLPPVFWIPAVSLLPAVVLGWIGLK